MKNSLSIKFVVLICFFSQGCSDRSSLSEDLPSYYFPYIKERVENVNRHLLGCSERSWTFFFITDTHPNRNYGNSGKLLSYCSNHLPTVKDLIFGGDIGTSTSSKWGNGVSAREALLKSDSANSEILNSVKPKVRVYRVRGNHDYSVADADYWRPENYYDKGDRVVFRPNGDDDGGLWSCIKSNSDKVWVASHWEQLSEVSGYQFSAEETFSMIMGDAISNGDIVYPNHGYGCYYYMDRPQAELRVIFMNTCDTDKGYYGISNVAFGVSDDQIEWIMNNAVKTTPDGWDMVFVFHIPINKNASLSQDYVNRSYAKELRGLFSAINKRQSITIRGKHYDFTGFKPKIAMVLSGHTHSDLVTKTDDYFALSCSGDFSVNETAFSPLYVNLRVPQDQINRKKRSIREQSFDIAVYDKEHKYIKFFRVGQGVDRYLNLVRYNAQVGVPLKIESSLQKSGSHYYCYDANNNYLDTGRDRYTYSQRLATVDENGVVTPISEGEIVVAIYSPEDSAIELTGITIVR